MYKQVLFAGLVSLVGGVRAAPAAEIDERMFQPRDSAVSALFEKRQSNPSDPSEFATWLRLGLDESQSAG